MCMMVKIQKNLLKVRNYNYVAFGGFFIVYVIVVQSKKMLDLLTEQAEYFE